MEARGAKIAAVRIEIHPVFDLSDPHQDNWIGHLANAVHINTHESVIRHELTIHAGDAVDARRVHEAERDLRTFRFVKDAEITPEVGPDGVLTAVVSVRDAWTLKLSAGYSQVGGRHSWSFGLQDQNLLGSGKALAFRREVDPDRTSNALVYNDRQVFGSRWVLSGIYQSLSDGYTRGFGFGRPFFALDTPWSFEASASTTQSRVLVFDRNTQVFEAPSKLDGGKLGFAWRVAGGGKDAWRLGLQGDVDDARYGPLTVDGDPGLLPPPVLAPRR
ncbi:MAG TPA: hypothetical protein VFF77_08520, partial [Holophagaceae bacterium]|nr:hypothetical protein [Holophagaceae bacterium]